jgi:hypothetical protein
LFYYDLELGGMAASDSDFYLVNFFDLYIDSSDSSTFGLFFNLDYVFFGRAGVGFFAGFFPLFIIKL